MASFLKKYGLWALIAGGAQGIGEAFADYAAARGLNVVVLDRERTALDNIGARLTEEHGVECLPVQVDLATEDMMERVIAAVGDREVGLLVYNAAISDVGPFFKKDTGLEFEKARLAVNVTGPLLLTYHFAKPMLARRAGGIVLMSSGAGLKGAPYYAAYSATKAYEIALAQALWGEFKPYDVDVLAVAAGMTLSTAARGFGHLDTSGFQTTEDCVAEAMAALGKQPLIISGEQNRATHAGLKGLPDDQVIEAMAAHAVENFLGGTPPEQAID